MQETGDAGSIPGSRRSSGEGKGNPLQSSRLQKSHGERSLAGYRLWSCKELDTEHLSMHTCREQQGCGWSGGTLVLETTPCFFLPDSLPALGTGVTVNRQAFRTFLFPLVTLSSANSICLSSWRSLGGKLALGRRQNSRNTVEVQGAEHWYSARVSRTKTLCTMEKRGKPDHRRPCGWFQDSG